jgi:hypothetical protein
MNGEQMQCVGVALNWPAYSHCADNRVWRPD